MENITTLLIILAITVTAIVIAIVVVIVQRRSNKKAARNLLDCVERLKRDPTNPGLQEQMLDLMGSYSDRTKGSKEYRAFNEALTNHIKDTGATGVIVRSPTIVTGKSVAQEIEKLSQLLATGVITEGEFERGKTFYLGAPPDKAASAVELLEDLDALRKKGVLSESEFNTKKWEILSEQLLPDDK